MRQLFLTLFVLSTLGCARETTTATQQVCTLADSKTIALPAANVVLGLHAYYPEERERKVQLEAFDIDETEVTNTQFRNFIIATGYVTTAEKVQPGSSAAGGAVFRPPSATNPNWWQFVEGANWQNPEGPDSTIDGRENHPVVQVSLVDARAYAEWAGRSLPTEDQWEYAARGRFDTTYVWGEKRAPGGVEQANTWQGAFPIQNTEKDGYRLTAPVGCFEPNSYGLYDMIGNVWEWTLTEYEETPTPNSYAIKGGSFLCAPNYCARYRAPARQSQEADFSTNHIGFRTVSRE